MNVRMSTNMPTCTGCGLPLAGSGHWSNCPVARSIRLQHRLDESDAIVREMAERGPFVVHGIQENTICSTCNVCTFDLGRDRFNDPANHEPTCLWRRARELYPEGAG